MWNFLHKTVLELAKFEKDTRASVGREVGPTHKTNRRQLEHPPPPRVVGDLGKLSVSAEQGQKRELQLWAAAGGEGVLGKWRGEGWRGPREEVGGGGLISKGNHTLESLGARRR